MIYPRTQTVRLISRAKSTIYSVTQPQLSCASEPFSLLWASDFISPYFCKTVRMHAPCIYDDAALKMFNFMIFANCAATPPLPDIYIRTEFRKDP